MEITTTPVTLTATTHHDEVDGDVVDCDVADVV